MFHNRTKEDLNKEKMFHIQTKEELNKEKISYNQTKEELDECKRKLKQSTDVFNQGKSEIKRYAQSIIVGGYDCDNQLSEKPNNINKYGHPIIDPPVKLSFDPSSLLTCSVSFPFFNHASFFQ